MKKIKLLSLVILATMLMTIGCSKKDARNIRYDDYRVTSIITNDGRYNLLSTLFPGSQVSQVLFTFDRSKIIKLYLEGNESSISYTNTVIIYNNNVATYQYWDYSGNYYYDYPTYEYAASGGYSDNYKKFKMNFDVPTEYQNTNLGNILWQMSASKYSVKRTNGLAISKDEEVTLVNGFCTIVIVRK